MRGCIYLSRAAKKSFFSLLRGKLCSLRSVIVFWVVVFSGFFGRCARARRVVVWCMRATARHVEKEKEYDE